MSRKKIVHRAILGIGMALLIIALLIMIILRSNIDAKYVKARNATGEALYNQLYMMCQTFDQVNVPDQEATAIPIMKNYFLSANPRR